MHGGNTQVQLFIGEELLENNPINLLQIIFISMHVNLTTKWVI
jgi:hypothetical protein